MISQIQIGKNKPQNISSNMKWEGNASGIYSNKRRGGENVECSRAIAQLEGI